MRRGWAYDRRAMSLPRATAAVALVVLAVGGATSARGAAKPVHCQSGKVQVQVGKKKPKCKPFASVFPEPTVAEYRLTQLQAVLESDPRKWRGKNGKRPRLGPKPVVLARKEANAKFVEVLPQALVLIDQANAGTVASAPTGSARARASAGCSAGGESTGAGSSGGVSLSGTSGGSGLGGTMEYKTSSGLTVRITYVVCGTTGFFLPPECPKADGSVDTQTHGTMVTTEEVRDGDTVVSRSSTTNDETIRVHGKVAGDAKLDYIDVDYTQEAFALAGGGGGAPTVLRGSGHWTVRVDMRTGKYDLDGAKFTPSGDQGPIQKDNLARWVGQAINDFREAEVGGSFLHTDGWSTFDRHGGDYCVEPTFDPASDTKRLKRGETGPLKMYAKARSDGGKAIEARWTTENPENAQFSPSTSSDAEATINYTVATSPQGAKVRVTVRVTSTAGVGKKEWTQDLGDVNHIGGTFGGKVDDGYGLLQFSGNLTFDRFDPGDLGGPNGTFLLSSGDITVDASGGGPYGCQQSGHQGFVVPFGQISVLGTGANLGAPYGYSWFATDPFDTMMNVVLSSCPPGQESHEGQVVQINAAVPIGDNGGAVSSDGISFADGYVDGYLSESWSFQATP